MQRRNQQQTAVADVAASSSSLASAQNAGSRKAKCHQNRSRSWLLILIILLGAGLLLSYRNLTSPFDLQASGVAHLRDPAVSPHEPRLRVLQLRKVGDPAVVGKEAFSALFRAYYSMEGVSKFARPPAARARWPLDTLGKPKEEWQGLYAIPVPADARLPETRIRTASPSTSIVSGSPSLGEWIYGPAGSSALVAEILHLGPYTEEGPTIQRLMEFIRQQGFEVAGEHEEEYLHSTGLIPFLNPHPHELVTRISYPVRKTLASN